jgi:hypothetical protein
MSSDVLNLNARVELQAAAAGKPAKVSILAYSGNPMDVGGYGTVVIDLAGLEMPGTIPLLADHDASLAGVAGSGTPRVLAGNLLVEGTLAATAAGNQIRDLGASGVPLQASVGVAPGDRQPVRPGESVTANGRTFTAGPRGMILVKTGSLREVSITPLGADPSTSVSITAKGQPMTTEISTATPGVSAEIQAERARVRDIRAVCRGEYPEFESQAIECGWSVDQLKIKLFDEAPRTQQLAELRASRPSAVGRHGGGRASVDAPARDVIMASALLMAGRGDVAVKHVHNGERLANSLSRPAGWPEIAATALRAEGRDVPHDRTELLRAAFSTTSLPNALGSSVEKIALSVFLESASTALAVCRPVSASTFRAGKALRLAAASKLEKIGPTGEIKHGVLTEDAFDYQVSSYARMFGISREDLINDDAGILAELPLALGNESARTLNDLFITTLVAGDGTFYSSGHGNKLTGGSSALSINGLTSAVATLRTRTDADGRVIGFVPMTLVVPAALENTAREILFSQNMMRDQTVDRQPTANPIQSLNLALAVEARLDTASTAAWYLFAQSFHGAILLATLGGRMGAIVETAQAEFDTLGWQWRAYMDVGVSLGEYRATVKSAGS